MGQCIRVLWEGSEYRGRGHDTVLDDHAVPQGNSFERFNPINHYNLDKRFELTGPEHVGWSALTTGSFDAILEDPQSGTIKIDTALAQEEIAIKDIGRDELIFANSGIDRRIRIFHLPDINPHRLITLV